MADCYYHGYSGSSGNCRLCEIEDMQNKKRGDISGYDLGKNTEVLADLTSKGVHVNANKKNKSTK